MQQQCRLARRRRALERRAADADDGVPAREVRQHLAQPLRSREGVELVPRLGETWCRVEVVVGAERDDEHIGLVNGGVGRHAPRLRVDGRDRFTNEPHARLRKARVRQPHGVGRGTPEHDIELRVSEDERVARIDQRDGGFFAELLGEDGRELEPAKPRAENDDSTHAASLLVGRNVPEAQLEDSG